MQPIVTTTPCHHVNWIKSLITGVLDLAQYYSIASNHLYGFLILSPICNLYNLSILKLKIQFPKIFVEGTVFCSESCLQQRADQQHCPMRAWCNKWPRKKMTGLTCINYFFHCCEKTPDKKQLRGGKIYFNVQCADVAHPSRNMAVEVWGSWSHSVCGQEAEHDE